MEKEIIIYDAYNGCVKADQTVINTLSNLQPKIMEEPIIGALIGRNPDDPKDRTVGAPTQQRLEIKNDGTSNTLTTVQKDNVVVEPFVRGSLQENASIRKDGICSQL